MGEDRHDLLVESMKNYAFYEVTRQRIEEMRQQNSMAEPPQMPVEASSGNSSRKRWARETSISRTGMLESLLASILSKYKK
jgi:hypothetical protein